MMQTRAKTAGPFRFRQPQPRRLAGQGVSPLKRIAFLSVVRTKAGIQRPPHASAAVCAPACPGHPRRRSNSAFSGQSASVPDVNGGTTGPAITQTAASQLSNFESIGAG